MNDPRRTILVLSEHFASDPKRVKWPNHFRGYTFRRLAVNALPRNGIGKVCSIAHGALTCVLRVLLDRPAGVIIENHRIGVPASILLGIFIRGTRVILWSFNTQQRYHGVARWLTAICVRHCARAVVYSRHEQALYCGLFGVHQSRFKFKLLSGPYLDDPRYQTMIKLDAQKSSFVVCPGVSGRDFPLLARVAGILPRIEFLVLAYPWALGDVRMPENVRVVHGVSELEYCRIIADARLCFVPIANRETANGHIAIIQAMSLGTALVTNLVPGTREYVRDGVTCRVVVSDDDRDFAGEIMSLLEDEAQRTQLVRRARAFAVEQFTAARDWETVIELVGAPS